MILPWNGSSWCLRFLPDTSTAALACLNKHLICEFTVAFLIFYPVVQWTPVVRHSGVEQISGMLVANTVKSAHMLGRSDFVGFPHRVLSVLFFY